jgi:hypothetical protein
VAEAEIWIKVFHLEPDCAIVNSARHGAGGV